MTDQHSWVPADVDPERPSIARIYDFYLGGSHNLPADRDAGREIVKMMPELPDIMRVNRAFLRRCVHYLAGEGILNFLDLGSGIPTVGNVHEIAQGVDAAARVVYVDNDPVAVAYSQEILAGNDRALIIQGDLRDAPSVLADPEVNRLLLLGLGEPVALLMSAVLHFITDDAEAAALIAAYRDALAPGSYLLVSHASDKPGTEGRVIQAAETYSRTVAPMKLRTLDDLSALLAGFELIDPGVVYCSQWRPDPGEEAAAADPLPAVCALARKR